MSERKNEIILFENQGVKLEVNLKDETVWLTQEQMSKLFEKAKSTINEHIKNIYKEGELVETETMTKFGNSEFADKPTNYYNLDMIISVGYRVKSQNGILFRKWATKVLKDYMLKGYAVNTRRLEYLEKTIKLIDIANRIDERLEGNDAKEILKVIGDYSKALDLLDDYDHRTLKKIDGNIDERKIEYTECLEVINKLRFNEESSLFAVERDKGLESIIGNIYQNLLKQKGIRQSMSRKGNCLDNACAENFFGILKSELYYIKEKEYKNIEELEKDIVEYIEYYNNRRIKSKLKGMSPVEYREHSMLVA